MQARVRGRLLHGGKRDTRFDRNRCVGVIDRADDAHAAERNDHLASRRIGRRGAAHAGVAALGNDRDVRPRACNDDGRNLLRVGGSHDRKGLPAITAAPVDEIGLDFPLRRQNVLVPDDFREPREHRCTAVLHGARY